MQQRSKAAARWFRVQCPAVFLVCLCSGLAATLTAAHASRVTVVYTSAVEAYSEAASGLADALRRSSMEAVTLDLVHSPASDAVQQAIRRDGPAAVVAIGSHALTAVTAAGYGGPLIATMIMRGDGQDIGEAVNAQVAGAIYLDVPLATLLTELSEIFPRAQRVGIIRNAARPGAVDAGAVAKSRSSGFTIRVVDCARTEDLLPAFLSLKGKVDFVLALPDSALYNSGTLKGLILASIANRLPIIGFSASFVRSGAAVGLFASYRDVGEQTADVVRRVLSRPGVRAVEESPSRWIFAVNLRVLRLIGLEHGQPRSAQLVVYR